MKENAPEKIYVDANEHWHRTHSVFTEKAKGNDIEYICTDAFIEKTEKFMNKVNEYLYHCVSEECDYVDTDKFIEDFKNYMKRE